MSVPEALAELAAARSPAIDETLRARFGALLEAEPRLLHRDGGPGHMTASAFVVDAPGEHVALLWHRKGGFWVQPGGHVEEDETSFERAARREVAEEIGLAGLQRLGPGPAMLHHHGLDAAFGSCREHFDVQFLLRAPAPAAQLPLAPSPESPRVCWARWEEYPAGTVADIVPTLRRLRPVVRELIG
ncbi:NUDIX hydrolase [Brachybacterium hainanense]|uniref:NUDIX hydrolase n=1 Tax=Brachybacterium hainanense TaxID=1541174 RepID=A0ABV6RFG0_9MICO